MLTSRGISLVKILYLRDEPTRHNADIFRIQYSFLVIPFLIYEVVMVFKKLLNLFYQNLARFNFFSKRDVDISYSCLAIDWQVYMKHIKVKKTHLYIAPKRKLWNFLSY